MGSTTKLSFEEFLHLPEETGKRFELDEGELIVEASPTFRHNVIRDRIARFVSVQRCVLGQPAMAAAPVRDVDIVVHMWAGVIIHIHVIDEPIKVHQDGSVVLDRL